MEYSELFCQNAQALATMTYPGKTRYPDFHILEMKFINSTRQNSAFWTNYVSSPHRHAFFELHLVVDGSQVYKINNSIYELGSGALLLIPPMVIHSIPDKTVGVLKYALSFSLSPSALSDSALSWIDEALAQRKEALYMPHAQTIQTLFDIAFDFGIRQPFDWEDSIRQTLSLIITALAQQSFSDKVGAQRNRKTTNTETKMRIRLLDQFIRDNIDMPLDAQTLSRYLHISTRQLTRNVLSEKGVTPRQLVENIRFEIACSMLSQGASRAEIVQKLGFPDESVFCRFFKKNAHMTASQWKSESSEQHGNTILDIGIPDRAK